MKDYEKQKTELRDFINKRLIITGNDTNFVLCSDIHYFVNQNRDYRDTITYRTINQVLKEYEGIQKKTFSGTMNVVGMKWRTTTVF